jgi:lambda repressor-like predicted transcriptional regulator
MLTLNRRLVEDAIKATGIDESIINQLTRPNFYNEVMSATDPDSKDIFMLYGVLGIENKDTIERRKPESDRDSKPATSKGMVSVSQTNLIKLIKSSGWEIAEFCQYAGLSSASNLNYMLKRGTVKYDTACAIAASLGVPLSKIASESDIKDIDVDKVPQMPEKFKKRSNDLTIHVSAAIMKEAVTKFGLSYEAFASEIHAAPSLIKEIMTRGGRIPQLSAYLMKMRTGVDASRPVSRPIIKPGRRSTTEQPKQEVKEPKQETKTTPIKEKVEEKKPEPERTDVIEGQMEWEEFVNNEKAKREMQEYLEGQHKQESLLRASSMALEERRKIMVQDGMISIETLMTLVSMLNTSPEIKDLFITLSLLPDDKRSVIINALNTLITALNVK